MPSSFINIPSRTLVSHPCKISDKDVFINIIIIVLKLNDFYCVTYCLANVTVTIIINNCIHIKLHTPQP